jgi:hypothetical protein
MYNYKVGRRQAYVACNGKCVAILETFKIDTQLEGYKLYVEKVMQAFIQIASALNSPTPIKKYNPKKIDGLEYKLDDNETSAMLRFQGVTFAHLNISGISASIDLTLRYIYHVTQSYIKYMKGKS